MWQRILYVTAVLAFISAALSAVPNTDVVKPVKSYTKPAKVVPGPAVKKVKTAERERSPFLLARDGEKLAVGNRVPEVKNPNSLYYYNSVDNDGIGLINGGTFQAAIRLTPEELGHYAGNAITEVYFYHHESTTHSGNVILYGQGTPTSPGNILETVSYTTDTGGWVFVPLPNPILIDGNSDIWIAVEITHGAGEYPISMDQGHVVIGKGNWFYTYTMKDTMWHELSEFNLNYHWNIGVIVKPYGDVLDPMPPSHVSAYSDYTMPTEINLSWVDPTHYVGGDTLTDFHIEIRMSSEGQDTVFLDTVAAGVQQYTATDLTDGMLYTFFLRTVDINDSTSDFASVSWYAGGSPYPAPPHDLTATVLDGSTVELTWINPSTQADGTPLDDLAGINIYLDGELAETYATSNAGALITYDVTVTPGRHTFYVTAVDNESPQHESDPSNEVEVVTNAHAGGPDGYGYTFIDSDLPNGPEFEWIDASAGITYLLRYDSNVLIQLPFAFPFYDQTLTEIYVVSNGFLSSSDTRDHNNIPLPDNTKNNIIAPFWDILFTYRNNDTVYTHYDPEDSIFVIEWHRFHRSYFSGRTYTFEVIFYPNGNLKFQYLRMEDILSSSTVGIQGGDGSNDFFLQYACNGDPLTVHDSLAILWLYPHREHDVAVTAVQQPIPGNYNSGDEIIPRVTVTNNGQNAESFDVSAVIYMDNIIYTSTVAVDNLNAGDSTDLTFDPFTITTGGRYTFKVYTSLSGDENPHNDTMVVQFNAFGYAEDFEINNGFYTPAPLTGAWEWGAPTYGPPTAHSGTNLWGTLLGEDYENSADWKLYSVDYIATWDNPTFTFWQWYDTESGYDGGNVAVSTDNGATWTIVEPVGGYDSDSIVGLGGEPGFTGSSGDWVQATFNLNGITAGTTFKIRFRFGSDNSVTRAGWYIDDVAGAGLMPYLPDHDVGVSGVISPVGRVEPGVPVDVSATVRNYGANDETFDVTAIIYTESKDTVFDQSINLSLAPGNFADVSLGLFTPDSNMLYDILVFTSLTGDENASNDTAYAQFRTIIEFGDVIYVLDAQAATGDNDLLGVEFDGNYFYITSGNSGSDPNKVYVLDPTGTLLCAVDQPAHSTDWGWRDLAFDGDTLYASVDPNVDAFSIDVDTCQLIYYGSFAGPENPNRALAYRPSDGHFFTANFGSNIYEFDKANPSINTWPNNYAIYGAAYNPLTQTVWFSAQEINSYGYLNVIYEFDPSTGAYTGNTLEFPIPEGYTSAAAGGLTIREFNGAPVMFELLQGNPSDFIVGIYMGLPSVEEEPMKPTTYGLNIQQNPIYKTGVLNFTLPKPSDVEITLYDATGRLVSKLASGRFSAGSHTVTLNASKLANGVYFVHMKSNDFNTVKKVIVLR